MSNITLDKFLTHFYADFSNVQAQHVQFMFLIINISIKNVTDAADAVKTCIVTFSISWRILYKLFTYKNCWFYREILQKF